MQKTVTTLIIAFLCNLTLFAQNSAEAIVFSENGELFTAYLNGKQINQEPANRVKMPDAFTFESSIEELDEFIMSK